MVGLVKFYTFALASLVRPAPAELPQDRKVARVSGRSGAILDLLFFAFSVLHKYKLL